jgi:hypothetical protein
LAVGEISTTRGSVTIEGLHFRNGGSRYTCEIDALSTGPLSVEARVPGRGDGVVSRLTGISDDVQLVLTEVEGLPIARPGDD